MTLHSWNFAVRVLASGMVALGSAHTASAQTTGHPTAATNPTPAHIVEQFHSALAAGDSISAATLLDTSAVILESGDLETRADYLGHHLAADIAFARSAPSVRQVRRAEEQGGTAWVISTARTTGTFEGRPVDSDGAELIVLKRFPRGWRIVAIHWSSHRHRP